MAELRLLPCRTPQRPAKAFSCGRKPFRATLSHLHRECSMQP